jgi:4-amino-4-deoxy-L-arabinose transferase-like glycosyltransferase
LTVPVQIEPAAPGRRVRVDTYAFFFVTFALIVFLTHLPYLDLPYYWDELGQFIPAALDLFRRGLWVPRSTIPNVHPPGLMAYLAGVWSVCGASIEVTRLAMLLAASLAALLTFLLAIRLARRAGGAPALFAVLLLAVSPLFYTQAMLAQLDLPAMLFTVWALLLFLEDRFVAAALACVALVLVKETGIVAPAVFSLWLFFEGRRRQAAWFALPALALAGWLLLLWRTTGHLFGNAEFTDYNLFYPLHPVRLGVVLVRRFFYLFVSNFHWIGWIGIALAWRRSRMFRTRPWRIAAVLSVANVLLVSVLGGAALERYLLPALPVLYIAMAAAWSSLPSFWARLGQGAMIAGMLASLFWGAPYPYPFENNLALVDFVRLQQSAAAFLEQNYPDRSITTAWPLSAALRRPDLGYVSRKLRVRSIPGFRPAEIGAVDPASVSVFVLYSREWENEWDPRRLPVVEPLLRRFYGYAPQVTPAEVQRRFGLTPVGHWAAGSQWVEVLASERQPR